MGGDVSNLSLYQLKQRQDNATSMVGLWFKYTNKVLAPDLVYTIKNLSNIKILLVCILLYIKLRLM